MNQITRSMISAAAGDRNQLSSYRQLLVVDRMKMDKFFSVFLENETMSEEDITTPAWFTYKEMSKSYNNVNTLINTIDYYIRLS